MTLPAHIATTLGIEPPQQLYIADIDDGTEDSNSSAVVASTPEEALSKVMDDLSSDDLSWSCIEVYRLGVHPDNPPGVLEWTLCLTTHNNT